MKVSIYVKPGGRLSYDDDDDDENSFDEFSLMFIYRGYWMEF